MTTENSPNLDLGTPGEGATEQTQEREFSSIEVKAIEQGWIPKEDFDGDEAEFIDAPEFVRRGELFKKIENTSRELKQVRQALAAFKEHHNKVKESEYNRALKALQDERKRAFVDGDHDRAFAIEEKIEEVRTEKEQIVRDANQPVEQDNAYTEQFQTWVEKNSWYETNKVMRKTADALGLELHQAGHSPAEVLRMVEKEIRQEFSHKFENPNTRRAPVVEGTTRTPGKTDSFVLSEDEKKVMNSIVSSGIMSKEDYIKELKRTR
jgi:hypothetical protein